MAAPDQEALSRCYEHWDRVCRHALGEHPELAQLITGLRPMAVVDGHLILGAYEEQGPTATSAAAETARAALEDALRALVERRWSVAPLPRSMIAGNARPTVGPSDRAQDPVLRQALRHPLIADLQRRFGADIIAREPSPSDDWQERVRRSLIGEQEQ